jgi:hypothetical protein
LRNSARNADSSPQFKAQSPPQQVGFVIYAI